MKNIILTLLAVGALLLILPGSSSAQYYGYYSPYFAVPPPRPVPSTPGQASFSYRLRADPLLYWKWQRYNAYSDYLQYQRSPLNPESDLSYMLRTF